MASTIWKGNLTFGLVSVPIKLLRAARAEKTHMHMLQRQTGTRIRRIFVPDEAPRVAEAPSPVQKEPDYEEDSIKTDAPLAEPTADARPTFSSPTPPPERGIPTSDLVRGFEYEKDRYIAFEPGELEELAPRSSSEMQIIEFVKFAEVDSVYLESSYYAAPDKNGEKPYSLLFEALKKTDQSAIAEFVLHRRDQIILLRAGRTGIIGHTLFHEDEVRRQTEFRVDSSLVAPREMELAIKLIDALAAKFEPEKFKDKYRERLKAAIEAKIDGMPAQLNSPASRAPVIDILTALKASLSQARKPAASEQRAAGAPEKKKRAAGARK